MKIPMLGRKQRIFKECQHFSVFGNYSSIAFTSIALFFLFSLIPILFPIEASDMDNTAAHDDQSEGKPRRLEGETMQYLLQLESQLDADAASQEVDVLVENVLEEIKTRTASAACDRNVNSVIEKICLVSSFQHSVMLVKRFTSYSLFLARNRHSSHVLQVSQCG